MLYEAKTIEVSNDVIFWVKTDLPYHAVEGSIKALTTELRKSGKNIMVLFTPNELDFSAIDPKEFAKRIPDNFLYKMGLVKIRSLVSMMIKLDKMAIRIDRKLLDKVDDYNIIMDETKDYITFTLNNKSKE